MKMESPSLRGQFPEVPFTISVDIPDLSPNHGYASLQEAGKSSLPQMVCSQLRTPSQLATAPVPTPPWPLECSTCRVCSSLSKRAPTQRFLGNLHV